MKMQSLSWKPHSYQLSGVSKLVSQGACGLLWDPGLGKTTAALAGFSTLKGRGFAKKMLVVAPLRAIYMAWPGEISKWSEFSGLKYEILHGGNKQAGLKNTAADIYLINPEGLKWLFTQKLPTFDILCVDESHMFKDSSTQRFKVLRKSLALFKRRWILTGTFAPRGVEGMFAQMFLLDEGAALGRYITHFRAMYMQKNYDGFSWSARNGAVEEIGERIAPYVSRLKAEDWLTMPQRVYNTVVVQLPDNVKQVYKDVEDHFIARLQSGEIPAANAAVAGIKCRQIASGFIYDELRKPHPLHDAKLAALENLVGELSGANVLVLFEFEYDGIRIGDSNAGWKVINSNTSPSEEQETLDKFNKGELSVLAANPTKVGTSLNIQGACQHIIFFGPIWSLQTYIQTVGRIYRQGQRAGTVFIHTIVASGTRDERVVEVLSQQNATQESIYEALKS